MTDAPETDASFLAPVSGACVIGINVDKNVIPVRYRVQLASAMHSMSECKITRTREPDFAVITSVVSSYKWVKELESETSIDQYPTVIQAYRLTKENNYYFVNFGSDCRWNF